MTRAHFDDNGAEHQIDRSSWASALQSDAVDESFKGKAWTAGVCGVAFLLFVGGGLVSWVVR